VQRVTPSQIVVYKSTVIVEDGSMKLGLGLVLLGAGCNLYFASNPGHDDAPPPPVPHPPDAAWPSADGARLDSQVPPDAEIIPDGLLPVAPTAGEFMWQSLQEHFKSNGVDCHGQVTLAVSDHAVCYVGVDDDLHCSGSTYTQSYGTGFPGLGKLGVDQIALASTYNEQNGNSICVHERAGGIECFGANNDWGNFGNGTTANANTWTSFGSDHVWKRFTTFAQIACAIDDANAVFCTGSEGYGATPVQVGTGSSVYITTFGAIRIDDATVWRAGPMSSYCLVEPTGLKCSDQSLSTGTSGRVVDGSEMSGGDSPGAYPACNLDDTGTVHCSVFEITERQFSARPNVAFAGSIYTDTHCAVGNDGSLWCRSSNRRNELGAGVTVSPYFDTQVLPPGSVKVTCN
jgi:hypothetical protein